MLDINEIKTSVEKGFDFSSFLFDLMNEHGFKVDKNLDLAIDLYRELSEKGIPEAQHNLGVILLDHVKSDTSVEESVSWIKKAAASEFLPSMYLLGYFYEKGIGVEFDVAIAAEWYEKAALSGHIQASINLGGLCEDERLENISYSSPVYWYERVATIDGTAAFTLANFYENGERVEKDISKALTWYLLASKLGSFYASNYLQLVYGKGLLGEVVDRDLEEKYSALAEEQFKIFEKNERQKEQK